MSGLARLSLANRSIVALVSFAALIFGLFAAGVIRQELLPPLAVPAVSISTTYAGAPAEIVERDVTAPIEAAIAGLDGLESRTSTSGHGLAVVQAQFAYGTDTGQAVADVEAAVDRISVQLPEEAGDPHVQTLSGVDFPVILLAASAETSQAELAGRLEDDVVPELASIAGVRDAEVTGRRLERVVVTLDQDALAAEGVTGSQITQALRSNGVIVPGGQLSTGGETLPVQIGDAFDSLDDLENLALSARVPTAGPVKLSEVATVRSELEPATTITRTDGKPTLGVNITKTTHGNSVDIAEAVKGKIPDLEEDLGGNAQLAVVQDQSPFITEAMESLSTEGAIGLGFAVLTILVFLLSGRSTLVTAVSIPLSLAIAIGGMYIGGYSFNMLTMGALTIAVGRVVDDSIVVLENINRHLGYGEEKVPAILAAVREVAGAITASTLTTVGVFLPIAFVSGEVGQIFRPFGVTVTLALLASLVVALTVIPVLAYWLLRPAASADSDHAREKALATERRNPLQRGYTPLLGWVTRHRVVTVLVGAGVLAGTCALLPLMKTNFLPPLGENSVHLTQTMPVGTSLAKSDEAAERVEKALAGLHEIEHYQVTVGGSTSIQGTTLMSEPNQADFEIRTVEEIDQTAFEDKLRKRLSDVENAGEFEVAAGTGGTDASSDSLEVVVSAPNDAMLRTAGERVADAVRRTPNTIDVSNNVAAELPTIDITVDRVAAAAYGLSESHIGQAVQQAMEGQRQATAVIDGREQDVVVRVGGVPDSLDRLRDLELATPNGRSVRLDQMADVDRVARAAEITRTDGQRTASITAKAAGADLGAVTADLTNRLDDLDLPPGTTYKLGGVSEEQSDVFGQLLLALAAAVAIVFTVMVATFRSIVQPLILLVSVPFAATGVIGLLLLTDTALGVPALIGMLMLVGIVVTNAIVLIDLINQYRAQGMSVRDAVVEGGRRRLRPILMTAVVTIMALLPMALRLTGGGTFISQPLAIVVIGGLVSSTLLTLVLVPALYSIVEGVKERRRLKPDSHLGRQR